MSLARTMIRLYCNLYSRRLPTIPSYSRILSSKVYSFAGMPEQVP